MASTQQTQCESRHYYVGAEIDNRYKLTQFIGAGGMACVYRAKETNTPHDFALKFLKDEYHNMDYLVQYFKDEASSMRDLAHPNIVRFYRFENQEDYSYIVMDYVDGFALSEVLKLSRKQNTAMPLDEVVRVITQIARALDAIHRDTFVHRDIKPSNVLIDRRTGQAFLTDLGITSAQGVKIEGAGTIAYMSPEQAETWMADHRSDIYAYGILIYEMLTGKRPFNLQSGLRGAEAEADLIRKHKEAAIPDVTAIRGDLPQALNGIIAKAMAKKPDDRYQSVIEFAQDVHRVLKPKLSADLQDFATIQHRQIAAPELPVANPPDTMLRVLMFIGVVAIILASFIILEPIVNPDPTATASPTVTQTHTPVPTATPTQSAIDLIEANQFPLLSGSNAFPEPDSSESLLVIPDIDNAEPFNYLAIGAVNSFSVRLDIASTENSGAYGVAFRMQDGENYHYFAIDPATMRWDIFDVVDNVPARQLNGTLTAAVEQLTVAGSDNFFEIHSGDMLITTYTSDLYSAGSLAVYVASGELLLDDIEVRLLGDEAEAALVSTPTQTSGLADPLRFLRDDVEAMLETIDIPQSTVDCPAFSAIHDSLDRHSNSPDSSIQNLADNVRDTGVDLREKCLIEGPNRVLLVRPLSILTDLHGELREILGEMDE